jgi:hypothetical protein
MSQCHVRNRKKTYSATFFAQNSAKHDGKDDKYVVPWFNV